MSAGCGWPAQLAASFFNRLNQYASSPDNRAYCYAELAVSFLVVAEATSILIAPIGRGMARLNWRGWLVTYRDGMPARRWSL